MSSDTDDPARNILDESLPLKLFRHLVVAFLGALFALALYKVWSLDGRWFYVTLVAIVMLAAAAVSAPRFSHLLLLMVMFCLPAAGFGKWLFVSGYNADVVADQVYSGMISIGIYEFIIGGLYMSWFFRVIVTREQPLPRVRSMDIWVLSLVTAYALSIPGSIEPSFGIFALVYLIKHVLLYFYISRNFQYRHVKWFIAAMIFAIFINASLGFYQKLTGNLVGIALDKGAGGEQLNQAYEVFGLDNTRSTGTTYDSHALGMLMGMAIQFTLALLLRPHMKTVYRFVAIGVLVMATATLFFSYSRTAWLSTMIASSLITMIMFFRWRNTRVFALIGVGLAVIIILSPWLIDYIYERFDRGTTEVLGYRYDQWVFAIKVWMEAPILGNGIGNYMFIMQTIEDFGNTSPLPVHNMYLWILCDTGIVGAIVWFGMIFSAMRRLWSIATNNQTLISCLSLGAFMSLIVFLLDGITNPIFREPMVYILFWFYIAFSVIFPEFTKMSKQGTLHINSQIN